MNDIITDFDEIRIFLKGRVNYGKPVNGYDARREPNADATEQSRDSNGKHDEEWREPDGNVTTDGRAESTSKTGV